MSLYLCVFDEHGEEIDGVDVGTYSDFGLLRDVIRDQLEGGVAGSRFRTFMLHSDCDGSWSATDAVRVADELQTLSRELRLLSPMPLLPGWKQSVARLLGITPASLYENFFDVDGEPLLDRMLGLCRISIARGFPILFQ